MGKVEYFTKRTQKEEYVPEIDEYGINIDRYELRDSKLFTIIEKVVIVR